MQGVGFVLNAHTAQPQCCFGVSEGSDFLLEAVSKGFNIWSIFGDQPFVTHPHIANVCRASLSTEEA